MNKTKIHGIFTSDRRIAEKVIYDLTKQEGKKIKSYLDNENFLQYDFEEGDRYIWFNPQKNYKGCRCYEAIVDVSTCSEEYFQKVIKPMCVTGNFKFILNNKYERQEEI